MYKEYCNKYTNAKQKFNKFILVEIFLKNQKRNFYPFSTIKRQF